jgi:hypothetical protein
MLLSANDKSGFYYNSHKPFTEVLPTDNLLNSRYSFFPAYADRTHLRYPRSVQRKLRRAASPLYRFSERTHDSAQLFDDNQFNIRQHNGNLWGVTPKCIPDKNSADDLEHRFDTTFFRGNLRRWCVFPQQSQING